MSGLKCSEYHLDVEREQRNQLLTQVATAQREIEGIRHQLADALGRSSEVRHRDIFKQVQETKRWLQGTQEFAAQTWQWSIDNVSSELSAGLRQLQDLIRTGQQALARLTEACATSKLRAQGEAQLSTVEVLFYGDRSC